MFDFQIWCLSCSLVPHQKKISSGYNRFSNNFEKALNLIMPFHTMYLLEAAFSGVTIIKLNFQSILENIEVALCPIPSNIDPALKSLYINKLTH